jgi:hypothetical protein
VLERGDDGQTRFDGCISAPTDAQQPGHALSSGRDGVVYRRVYRASATRCTRPRACAARRAIEVDG